MDGVSHYLRYEHPYKNAKMLSKEHIMAKLNESEKSVVKLRVPDFTVIQRYENIDELCEQTGLKRRSTFQSKFCNMQNHFNFNLFDRVLTVGLLLCQN